MQMSTGREPRSRDHRVVGRPQAVAVLRRKPTTAERRAERGKAPPEGPRVWSGGTEHRGFERVLGQIPCKRWKTDASGRRLAALGGPR